MKNERINIGDFNDFITWMEPTSSRAPSGQTLRSFAAYRTALADVKPAIIAEGEMSGRVQYAENYTFTTHYDAAINSKWQIVWGLDNYNIIRIEKLNLSRFIRVTGSKIIA